MLPLRRTTLCVTLLSLALLPGRTITAADVPVVSTPARSAQRSGRSGTPGESSPKTGTTSEKDAKPDGDKKPKDGDDSKSDKSKSDEEKESKPLIIKRSDKWDGPSTTDRMQDQLGSDGLVHFNLQGVPWPELLQWLADTSQLSLDWQELPGDYLNLRTQHGYTVEEAQDVINRHLLARGFTMLKHGELLTVANIKKLNQGFVPRVTPQGLDEQMPHQFVKVSFPLDWMLAKDAVEELKPMLSPNGKLTALNSTNRLEAMDAVVNLREIRALLLEEQTGTGQKNLVRVFSLDHVRARDILPLVEQIIGLENHSNVTGNVSDGSARQIMQQMQQMQQLLQRNQSNSAGKKGGGGGKPGDQSKPRLIVNQRENSIVAVAPPDKMEIIVQTIEALDTPSRREASLLQNMGRFKVHRLSTLDPAPLVSILNELGDLSPTTKLEIDQANKTLIVYGSLADQVTVQTLVDKLDGSSRNFYVIPLRRLRAEDVAGTILYMLGEEEEDNSRQSDYYSYYSYRYSNNNSQNKAEEKRPFRVDADIENNRLMLWANEVEHEEVSDLLVKMGEISSGTRSNETVRFIELLNDREADEMLERIRRLWPRIAPNELEIETRPRTSEDDAGQPVAEPTASTSPPSLSPPPERSPADTGLSADLLTTTDSEADRGKAPDVLLARSDLVPHWRHDWAETRTTSLSTPAVGTIPPERLTERLRPPSDELAGNDNRQRTDDRTAVTNVRPEGAPPPVLIQRGPDGRLILGSSDTQALNQLEDLLADLTPKRRDFTIFKLKHPGTFAIDVEWNLNAFFEQETGGDPIRDWYGNWVNQKDDSPSRLSRRKPLKIIGDAVSRTILVQGATQDQLRTIAELIEIYDQPETDNPLLIRETRLFTVKYSNAYVVADAIKDAYRDLLSPNDPALEKKQARDEKSQGTTIKYDYGSRYGNDDDDAPERPGPIRFKGALSMGVDEISNTVIVSAARGLLDDIGLLIADLDELAKSANNIQVLPVDSSINLNALQERMAPVLHITRPGANGRNGQPDALPQGTGNGERRNFNNGTGRRR